jgi:CBS domain-containing protein
MKVRDIMTRDVRRCRPEDDLATVGTTMAEAGCGVLPVVNSHEEVIGILTDRDICLVLADFDRPASDVRVGEAMTIGSHICRAGDDVETALFEMARHKVRRLPVVGPDRRLQGILSLDDVVLHAKMLATEGFRGPFLVDIGRTLRAICEHPGSKPN